MMSDNDWIKQLQSMMERHEEPVGDDLWQDIEARLPEQRTRRQLIPAWRRYAVAAAVALAVIGTGSLLWLNTDDSTDEAPDITMTESENRASSSETLPGDKATNAGHDAFVPERQRPSSVTVKKVQATAHTFDHIAQTSNPIEVTEVQAPGDVEQPVKQSTATSPTPVDRSNDSHMKDYPNPQSVDHSMIKTSRKRQPVTVGLYASNDFMPEGGANNKDYVYAFDALPVYAQMFHGSNVYHPEDIYTAKHHAPLSLGLNVRIPLTSRLSLTSGLVYTRLKSDFTSSSKHREQTLHYLGVPVGATYTLLSYKRFSVYAIGGMQADFNVKADLKESTQASDISIGRDRVQFSGLLGPGLQLDLMRGLGIYVEPTARYYFINGSDVENYFKDKPWNINLNAGLRLTLQ